MIRRISLHAATLAAACAALLVGGPAPASAQEAYTPPPPQSDAISDDPRWRLADQLISRIDRDWDPAIGAYRDRGRIQIRPTAMLLELHATAALAGHQGAARRDDRIPQLVALLTSAPVYVTSTRTKRTTASFPHTPAFASTYRKDPTTAPLHPSADAVVARSLAVAWRARDLTGLPQPLVQRIQDCIRGVARGSWYKAPTRAENQINWNADVYAANLEVNGDRSGLPEYRAHLSWFVDRAFKNAYKGGKSNLSRGYGFRYLPRDRRYRVNNYDTVEYANLVHSVLGYYRTFVNAGMRPLDGRRIGVLNRWSQHILFGTWTHSGYLNWDTGLGTSRRHLQQYWAYALESLIKSSGPGALLGTPDQRRFVRSIAEQGLSLYSRIGWNGEGPLPLKPTSFDAPNGFPTATRSPLVTPLRFALISASLDLRLPATAPRPLGNAFSHDSELGRLAISTPGYNLAVLKPVFMGEGGLEPTRLFDGSQRPLMPLGAGSFSGAATGLRLSRGGTVLLDTQPGTQQRFRVPAIRAKGRTNRAGAFGKLSASGAIRKSSSRISVSHTFETRSISTTYRWRRGKAATATLNTPVWGANASIEVLRGASVSGGAVKRTSGALLVRMTTADGAKMLVSYRGIPRAARIYVVKYRKSARSPQGARELRIRFSAKAASSVRRRMAFPSGT